VRLAKNLGALQERDFRLFFIGQSISLLGDGMAPLALSFAVLDVTGSVSDLGFLFAARQVSVVAFLLVGGVVADRLSRRTVMLSADLIRFASQGIVAALLISGRARIWELIVLQAVNGSASGFFFPAVTGLTPLVVSQGRLQQANALRGLAMSGGAIAGPAVAGVLVATVGSGWALAVDAASFGASVVFLAALRVPAHARGAAQSFVRDLVEGWHEFHSRTWLWSGVVAASVANLMFSGSFGVLGPAIAKRSLGGAGAWALVLSSFNLGALIGGLVALRLRPRRPFFAAFAAYVPVGLPLVLLALGAPAWGIAAGAFVGGGGLLLGNTLWETTLQQKVSPAALSRVTSYDWFGSLGMAPIGFALVGPLSAAIGVHPTLWLAAAGLLAVDTVVLALPSVRHVEAEPVEPARLQPETPFSRVE
jgi:Transmembrane secretion effector